jgi:hypothetical protein
VNISNSVQNLLENNLCFFLIRLIFLAADVLFEVKVVVIEYDFEQLLLGFVENVDEGNDVGVLFEGFEK